MTRKVVSLFLSALFALFITACSAEVQKPLTEKSTYGELSHTYTSPEINLDMYVEKTEYEAPLLDVDFEIKNSGPGTIHFGVEYQVDKLEQGVWHVVPFRENHGVPSIGVELEPEKTYQGKVEAASFDYSFPPGEYRIIKKVYLNGKDFVLATVFHVKELAK